MTDSIHTTRLVTSGTAGVDLPLEVDGCYFLAVRNESGKGAAATFSLAGGQVCRLSSGKGSDGESVSILWDGEHRPQLHTVDAAGEYAYTVKWWGA